MTERRAGRPIVDDDGDVAHHPFGGYAIETERLPDGRRIHYYAWPAADADADADAAAEAQAPEPEA